MQRERTSSVFGRLTPRHVVEGGRDGVDIFRIVVDVDEFKLQIVNTCKSSLEIESVDNVLAVYQCGSSSL